MLLETLPDAGQQILIAWFLLYCSYKLGGKHTKWAGEVQIDVFYHKLVKYNLISVAILYAEAIFLETLVGGSDEDIPDPLKDLGGDKTEQWLKQHNGLFWFVLAIHQALCLGIIGYELMSAKKVRRAVWVGLLPPLVQWHIGLFATDPITGAIAGLIFEAVIPLLLCVYGFKIVFSGFKSRASYAFAAVLSYVVSTLPVFFLGTQMRSPHHALYLTVFFGVISFYCWTKSVAFTIQKTTDLGIDGVSKGIFNQVEKQEHEARFTIGGEDITEEKDESV